VDGVEEFEDLDEVLGKFAEVVQDNRFLVGMGIQLDSWTKITLLQAPYRVPDKLIAGS